MSRIVLWSVLLVVLVSSALILMPRAEAWSEPVYTKPWTEEEAEDEEVIEETVSVPEEVVGETVMETKEAEEEEEEIDEFLLDFTSLYGTWYIWTPTTVRDIRQPGDGDYVTHEVVDGADQGMVVVNPDGTYSMSHAAWDKDAVVEGKWRLSHPREINGEVVQAIVLLDGITDVNWAVAPSVSGKIRLLWAMEWADGSATWIFDAELYCK